MTSFNSDERRKIIMKHYSTPSHAGELNVQPINQLSNHCVDKMELYIEFDNEIIKNAKHTSEGCAVFKASTDIMVENIIGKNKVDVIKYIENYNNMITGKTYDDKELGELMAFQNVTKNYNRLHCAEMIYLAIRKAINP